MWKCNILRIKYRGKSPWYWLQQWFHGYDSKSTGNKRKNKQWGYMKLKSCAHQRKQSTKGEDSQWNGRKYLQTLYQIKDWYPKCITNLCNSMAKTKTKIKTKNLIIKSVSDLNKHFSKENRKMASRYMKRYSISWCTILYLTFFSWHYIHENCPCWSL